MAPIKPHPHLAEPVAVRSDVALGQCTDESWADAERRYHNENADKYVSELERGHIFHLADVKLLFSHLPAPGRRSSVILDAGCGPAISIRKFLVKRLRPEDYYIGVDIAERLLQVARANVPSGLFVRHDLQQMRLPPGCVDAVLCLGALHHLPQPFEVLERLLQALTPGGLLLLREPTDRAFRRGEGESPAEEGLNVDQLKDVAVREGCRIEREAYLTSWVFIHLRRYLHRFRLGGWERWTFPWRLKLELELLLDALARERLPRRLKGLDVYMVIRRPGSAELSRPDAARPDVGVIFSCPGCGSQLSSDDAARLRCACGVELTCNEGVWSFQSSDHVWA